MKVAIVNCFDTYEDRVDLLYEFFIGHGHNVTVIQSDFRHFKKEHRKDSKEGFIFVGSRPYYKNMSAARLYSHYKFAEDAFKVVEKIKPDLLYTLVPPNSLARSAAKYKQNHKDVKLIFDLIDLWPETMPIGKIKKLPLFAFWKEMRDISLKFADFVILECDLYKTVLGDTLNGINTETLYLAKKDINITSTPILSEDEIHLAYLGSINNIIDIPKIKEIIVAINEIKPVTLHIIGDGENREKLISAVEHAGASVVYHGKIYDPQSKQDIFDKCHFGLNIMKSSVCVGLTIKSVDYFQHGLPIINNIPGDTTEIINKYKVGINIDKDLKSSCFLNDILNSLNCDIKQKCISVFNENFSIKKFYNKLDKIIDYITRV